MILIVASDRISAFDWVLPTTIPDKGAILTQLSLFWFELAAAKNHAGANLKAAELKLLAQDKTLHDFKSAIAHLNNIESTQQENPEFHYLVAVSYLHGENRDMVKAISHIRKAISIGNRLNWDVSDWEDQYKLWTTGKVYIVD